MSTLHLVFESSGGNALIDALRAATGDDSILLLQEGVYAAATGHAALALLSSSQKNTCVVYALDADLRARGLASRVASEITIVNDEEFVALTERHERTVSWF